MTNKCSSCNHNNSNEYHTCPYREEISNDDETQCDCCNDCTRECANEV